MKTLIRIAVSCLVLASSSRSEEPPSAPPPPAKPAWSLVYLPSLDWTEAESRQTVELLRQVKPDLVVSIAACPFAEELRNLEGKPVVLDGTQRGKAGTACGIPPVPMSAYADTSTFHAFGSPDVTGATLVWLSAGAAKRQWNGPIASEEELRTLARMQIRKQFAERKGRVVFLVDPSVPTPPDGEWSLPISDAHFEQAKSGIAGFTCIRPATLRTELPPVAGISPRTPLIHWIRPGDSSVAWEILPIDGGPAIERKVPTYDTPLGAPKRGLISWLKAPVAPSEVPRWMDDYINRNPALGCGENSAPFSSRRFGWSVYEAQREPFAVLQAPDDASTEEKLEATQLARGAVRSPGNLFSISVGQLNETGMDSEDGDDGTNVYLDDLHGKKSRLIYFAGLYDAWPTAATWFTDRYVITTGTGSWLDAPKDSDPSPRAIPLTIRLFDLWTGRAFAARGMGDRLGRAVIPTERIFFPNGDYANGERWRTLWAAVEAGYLAKTEQPPVSAEDAAANAKLSADPGLQWKDLGIWPPPETWRLASEVKETVYTHPPEKVIETGDPYLTCKQTAEGELRYTLAISGYRDLTQFVDNPPETQLVARASLLTSGRGCLPQVGTVQRMGDHKRFLLMAGNYQKPGTADSGSGKWMLLVDLLRHRSWTAHW